jgi:hypothetical protein
MTKNEVMEQVFKLVDLHWVYVKSILVARDEALTGKGNADMDVIDEIGVHYKSSGLHFAKHVCDMVGLEEKSELLKNIKYTSDSIVMPMEPLDNMLDEAFKEANK